MKRGISPLIASVLLIAFTVTLFVIISTWVQRSVVDPGLEDSGEKVSKALSSYDIQAKVKSAVMVDSNTVKISIENTGEKTIESLKVKIIGTEDADVVDIPSSSVDLLGVITKEVDFDSSIGAVLSVEIYPVVGGSVYTSSSGAKKEILPVSCLAILGSNPGSANGMYNIYPSGDAAVNVYCDMTTDGGGWTLIGKGREGWAWSNAGQGSITDVASNPNSNGVAYMPSDIVDAIIGKNVKDLVDGVRVYRYGLNQDWRFSYPNMNGWEWTMASSKPTNLMSRSPSCSGVTTGNTQDTYWCSGGNNCDRIFTWAWGGHNFVAGWSTGASCGCTDYGSDGWCYLTEGHVILRTQVYVRK